MQLSQQPDHIDNVLRKQPHQRRHNAGKLGVAVGEVFRAVQLVQKEARGGAVTGVLEQIVVGVDETALLVSLDGAHPQVQRDIAAPMPALALDRGKMFEDGLGVEMHRCALGLPLDSGVVPRVHHALSR